MYLLQDYNITIKSTLGFAVGAQAGGSQTSAPEFGERAWQARQVQNSALHEFKRARVPFNCKSLAIFKKVTLR